MRFPVLLFSLAMAATVGGCSGDKAASADAQPAAKPAKEAVSARRHDESSYAEPDKVRITDLALDLALDFEQKQLAGTATYTLDWTDPQATRLLLDTRELTIAKVEGEADGAWAPLQFALADADPVFGVMVPRSCPDVPNEVLHPRDTWPDKAAYDAQAKHVAKLFGENNQGSYRKDRCVVLNIIQFKDNKRATEKLIGIHLLVQQIVISQGKPK